MDKIYRILVIIPKTNMTTIGVFHNERCIFKDELYHTSYKENLVEALDNRRKLILQRLEGSGINLSKLDNVTAIGGLIKPVEGGTYLVNETMEKDLYNNYNGTHASNLGGLIAKKIADGLNIGAFIVDPPVVDELADIARYTGLPNFKRKSVFHALNQKAAARKVAQTLVKPYEETKLIVAHLGHGISIGVHQNGKVVDVNNGLHGEGPFSFERAGSIPTEMVIKLCQKKEGQKDASLSHQLAFESGLKAYFNIKNLSEMNDLLKHDKDKVHTIFQAMAYQVSKEIGSMSTVLRGHVDGIVLTGNLAHYAILTEFITEQTNWISDVFIYPGEMELEALCEGALRILNNDEKLKIYQ